MKGGGRADDRGTATLVAVALLALLTLGATTVALTAQAAQLSSHAQGVADVSALAAAVEARDARALGVASASCTVAAEVVALNDRLRLSECAVEPSGAVTVAVTGERGPWTLTRSSRAGTH